MDNNKEYSDEDLRFNTAQCKLIWKDLNYSIFSGNPISHALSKCFRPLKPKEKHILHDVTGYAEPGKFLAIIGPSGAGKTTMLNILCRRVRQGACTGEFTYNGVSVKSSRESQKYSKMIGYVMQHDALLPFLTVQETLLYSGMLTLPRHLSNQKKFNRILEIINELGLSKVAHQYVGNDLVRGISGGEKKRLSIAIELLRNPSVLFLDEPTSGLDAKNALRLCEMLSRLAHKYKFTVITTIHQPRSQIFEKFDLLLILAYGGQQVYFGPANETLGYFDSEGFTCPLHENPADYFIDCVTDDYKDEEHHEQSAERVKKLSQAWERNSPFKDINPNECEITKQQAGKRTKGASFLYQIFWITYMGVLNEIRNKPLLISRAMQNIFLAIILGVLFFQIDNDQSTINDRNGIIFFMIINSAFNEVMPTVAAFAIQREVFFRERDSKTYSILAFWIGKQISIAFFQLAFPALYLCIIYWMIGFQTTWYKFFIFFATLELVSVLCSTIGMILGSFLPPTTATALSPIFVIVSMVFSGFLVNLENIPSFIAWLQWLSFGKYAFESLVQNEYSGLTLTCTDDQLVGNGICPFTTGEEVIEFLNISELPIYVDLIIIFGMIVFFRFVLLFTLKKARPTGL